jgi:hypothetical protein
VNSAAELFRNLTPNALPKCGEYYCSSEEDAS